MTDICKGQMEVQMSRDTTINSYLTNLYEATCLSIIELTCQIAKEDISQLMLLLEKYLLGGKYFTALLASDVWCFIFRLCSSEMCYNYFKYLLQIHGLLKNRSNSMNAIILSNLLSRQFSCLSDKDSVDFIDNIEKNADFHHWKPFVRNFDKVVKKQLQQRIDTEAINLKISESLKNLEDQPCLNTFETLVRKHE